MSNSPVFPDEPGTVKHQTEQPKTLYEGLTRDITSIFWGTPVLVDDNGNPYCPGYTAYNGDPISKNFWDYVKISTPNGTSAKTPGICEVQVEKYRDLDKKKNTGTDGARLTIHGIEPAVVNIAITIWTPYQLQILVNLWKAIFPQSNKRPPGFNPKEPYPPAFICSHPELYIHGVQSLVFLRGDGPSPGGTSKTRVFNIRAIEYLQPGKSNATATVVKAIGGGVISSRQQPKASSNPKATGPG
jgi:hypothetical protein